jgi:hypothetical protein
LAEIITNVAFYSNLNKIFEGLLKIAVFERPAKSIQLILLLRIKWVCYQYLMAFFPYLLKNNGSNHTISAQTVFEITFCFSAQINHSVLKCKHYLSYLHDWRFTSTNFSWPTGGWFTKKFDSVTKRDVTGERRKKEGAERLVTTATVL